MYLNILFFGTVQIILLGLTVPLIKSTNNVTINTVFFHYITKFRAQIIVLWNVNWCQFNDYSNPQWNWWIQ